MKILLVNILICIIMIMMMSGIKCKKRIYIPNDVNNDNIPSDLPDNDLSLNKDLGGEKIYNDISQLSAKEKDKLIRYIVKNYETLNKKKAGALLMAIIRSKQAGQNGKTSDLERYRMIQRMIFSFGRRR